MKKKDLPVLIFDYDGTIHNIIKIFEPAMREGFAWLKNNYGIAVPDESSERIASCVGLNSFVTWRSYLPDLSDKIIDEVSNLVNVGMANAVYKKAARWYPGIKEELESLKAAGFDMVILSNCRITYRDAHIKIFELFKLFGKFYDCESFNNIPKSDIVPIIENDYPGKHIVIGDRYNDMECAVKNDLPFIGCLYGYGTPEELSGADELVDEPSELASAVFKLSKRI